MQGSENDTFTETLRALVKNVEEVIEAVGGTVSAKYKRPNHLSCRHGTQTTKGNDLTRFIHQWSNCTKRSQLLQFRSHRLQVNVGHPGGLHTQSSCSHNPKHFYRPAAEQHIFEFRRESTKNEHAHKKQPRRFDKPCN